EAGVPYQVRGGERFFQRPEIRRAMSMIRIAGAGSGALVDDVRAVLAPVGLAEELVAVEPEADLRRFATELETRADAAHPPTVQGVTLASLHAAKGLEWDVVF